MTRFNKLLTVAFGAACLTANSAAAFEFTGGDVALTYSAFSDDSDYSALSFEGSLEAAFNRDFGMQVDLSNYVFDQADETASNLTLHGLYHLDPSMSAGLFYGIESVDGGDLEFYGIEFGQELAQVDFEGYISHGDESGSSVTLVGIEVEYKISDLFSIGAGYDYADFEYGVSIDNAVARVRYTPTAQMSLYGEVGSLGAELDLGGGSRTSGSQTYVGIGMEYAFGATRGATFGERGFYQMIPGL